jgi:peptide deformylase
MPKQLELLKMGNKLLLEKSSYIEDIMSEETQEIIEDMLYTTSYLNERVGLAAPQVGILKRIIVYRVPAKSINPRYDLISSAPQEEIPWSVLINPVITPLSDKKIAGWEGCISVPGMLGEVYRYENIRYSGINEHNKLIERTVSGFHARLIQHEYDHLDGILYPMRINDITKFGCEDEILKWHASEAK